MQFNLLKAFICRMWRKQLIDLTAKPWFVEAYLGLLATISVVCWHTGLEILGIVVFPALLWLWAITRQTMLMLPVPLFFVPAFRHTLRHVGQINDPTTVITYGVVASVVLGVGALVYASVLYRGRLIKSPLFRPMMALAVALALPIALSPVPMFAALGLGVFLILGMIWSMQLNAQALHINYPLLFAKSIGWFASLTAVMTLITVALAPSATEAILHKDVNIGWSISNNIATYLVFALPLLFYLAIVAKNKAVYYVLIVLNAGAVLISGSRAGIIGLGIVVPSALIYLAVNHLIRKDLNHLLVALGLAMPLALVVLYFDLAQPVYERLFASKFFFYFDDRRKLLHIAWNCFRQHPVFGAGAYSAGHFIALAGGHTMSYHNVLFEAAATMGLVGVAAYTWFTWAKFKLLTKHLTPFKVMGTIAVVGSFVFALVDTSYMNPIYLYMLLGLLAVAEREP